MLNAAAAVTAASVVRVCAVMVVAVVMVAEALMTEVIAANQKGVEAMVALEPMALRQVVLVVVVNPAQMVLGEL